MSDSIEKINADIKNLYKELEKINMRVSLYYLNNKQKITDVFSTTPDEKNSDATATTNSVESVPAENDRSTVRELVLVRDFLYNSINQDLMSIPGIGRASVAKLNANNITKTDHLIGNFFLMERDEGKFIEFLEKTEICNQFAREVARNFVKKFGHI